MRRNDNVVGDCKCDQFYQVKVCTERDEVEDCAVPYLCKQVDVVQLRKRRIVGGLQDAVLMLSDVVYRLHWLAKNTVTLRERRETARPCLSRLAN